ncbi:DNA-3-methyladenine glycosylase family protein [Roseibium album]|uniref:DNA-3-methyladenine glycosylase II n=1 Tax=Roseibium album TaxID=311410 RepID=A0A0M6Z6H2_9HYPH|nr:DNA-3-methyladenine glycosylase [Roseibium album]MCR9056051.1 DNA-3-methyladenine glycosylase [Paracoccaceae bacterium]CTQ58368.1 DNA-3-methyladenine glycosylase [Roseibium album]CTQ66297.1 DNA-3-methyladenine glycosylase [Roseibium album]CTQ71293.1 DNA-3-methyladenine glycosylase [Roseibium album]
MKPIATKDDVQAGLRELIANDPRLKPIAGKAGELPLRRRAANFAGLAQIITAQQVSVASATAIFQRVQTLVTPLTAEALASFSDEDLAGAGLSRPKVRTLRAVGAACENGLDLARLTESPADEAHAQLCAIKGIGRWSADIFLLFCAGHPDIFPSGDLALQIAVRDAFGLDEKPTPKELDDIALRWAPNRAIAARLFWAWYRVLKQGRETLPV